MSFDSLPILVNLMSELNDVLDMSILKGKMAAKSMINQPLRYLLAI